MRILHLITRMDAGGSAVNTLISATEQARAGHDVSLAFGPSRESEMSSAERARVEAGLDAFRAAGGRVAVIPELARRVGPRDLVALFRIGALARRGFDVVHTHTSKAGALGRLAARRHCRRLVHTPHGHIFHGYFGAPATRLFLAVERWLARRCDALIALTTAERDDHLALGIGRPGQWHVVPSGVDVAAVRESVARRRAGEGTRRWDAVSVGRLVPVKGMDRLIEAWARVCRRRPGARLAIVGDGPERASLEAACERLGIGANVYFAGWGDPLCYLASARCFALLSRNEGMGRAVVEAMAAGLPCVVADVCGLRELVDDSVGRRVDGDDPEAAAAALLTGWDEATAARAVRRSESYSVAAMMAGLARVYGAAS